MVEKTNDYQDDYYAIMIGLGCQTFPDLYFTYRRSLPNPKRKFGAPHS